MLRSPVRPRPSPLAPSKRMGLFSLTWTPPTPKLRRVRLRTSYRRDVHELTVPIAPFRHRTARRPHHAVAGVDDGVAPSPVTADARVAIPVPEPIARPGPVSVPVAGPVPIPIPGSVPVPVAVDLGTHDLVQRDNDD